MKEELWKHQCELIHAMDVICRGFSDEDWIGYWLVYGVPDGTDTVRGVMDTYPNDDEFAYKFKQLQILFVDLVAVQCIQEDGVIHSIAEHLLY